VTRKADAAAKSQYVSQRIHAMRIVKGEQIAVRNSEKGCKIEFNPDHRHGGFYAVSQFVPTRGMVDVDEMIRDKYTSAHVDKYNVLNAKGKEASDKYAGSIKAKIAKCKAELAAFDAACTNHMDAIVLGTDDEAVATLKALQALCDK
jgi:hypothetical protein